MKKTSAVIVWAAALMLGVFNLNAGVVNRGFLAANDGSVNSAKPTNNAVGIGYITQGPTFWDLVNFPITLTTGGTVVGGTGKITLQTVNSFLPGTTGTLTIYGSNVTLDSNTTYTTVNGNETVIGTATFLFRQDGQSLDITGNGVDLGIFDVGMKIYKNLDFHYFLPAASNIGGAGTILAEAVGYQENVIDIVPEPSVWASVVVGGVALLASLQIKRKRA